MTPAEMDSLIYLQYPRKIGRDAALKAIGKAAQRLAKQNGTDEVESRRWIYKATKAYATSPAGQNPNRTLIPHPSTFYNQGRYLDDPREWQIQSAQPRFEPGILESRKHLFRGEEWCDVCGFKREADCHEVR